MCPPSILTLLLLLPAGAPEYLYMVLVLNEVQLPEEALFIIR